MRLRQKSKHLAQFALNILAAERPMTCRQLFYRMVSAGHLTNQPAEYRRMVNLATRLREAGELSRTWIVDHVRATLKPSSWSGLADFGDTVRRAYRKDFWASLPAYVAVFVEKDAVAGTVQPITSTYDVALHVCRGYASVSFAGEIADEWAQIDKPIFAYYVGDHDPSGFDIERDLKDKLERYSGLAFGMDMHWRRLAVNVADFDDHDLIRLPVKRADRRAAGYLQKYGDMAAEVDALPPTELRRRVEEAILGHVDADQWARLQRVEQAERDTMQRYVEAWDGAKVELDTVTGVVA